MSKTSDLHSSEWYQPEKDQEAEFLVRGLYPYEQVRLTKMRLWSPHESEDDVVIDPEMMEVLLQFGVMSCRNFQDSNGEPISIIPESRANLRKYNANQCLLLATKIWNLTFMTEEDKKKSESQSTSQETSESLPAKNAK